MNSKNAIWIWLVSGTLIAFLFLGGPEHVDFRPLADIWNLGHIVLFFLLVHLVNRYISVLKRLSSPAQLILTLLITIAISLPIEYLQSFGARDPNLYDIYRNCLGATLGILSIQPLNLFRRVVLILSILAVLHQFKPIVFSTWDWLVARKDFPMLADFHSEYQKNRFSGKHIKLSSFPETNSTALKVRFKTPGYSGFALNEFPRDWNGYGLLSIEVFNTSEEVITLVVRIYDKEHLNRGFKYPDRFNQSVAIPPGKSVIKLRINSIKSAPKGREMDLNKIQQLALFTRNLEEDVDVYFDNFQLQASPPPISP